MRVLDSFLRRLNAYRQSSEEQRLTDAIDAAEITMAALRAEVRHANATAEAMTVERDLMAKALERIRSHYDADIAVQARIQAQGGFTGERSMG